MIMIFGMSYQRATFFIGMAVVLFAISESKMSPFSDEQSNPFNNRFDNSNFSTSNSMPDSVAKGETPTATKKTTAAESVLVSSNSRISQLLSDSKSVDSLLYSLMSKGKQVKCEPLNKIGYNRDVVATLTPEIFSQSDPFRYLVEKTMKIYPAFVDWTRKMLNEYLEEDHLPRCYVPYAKTLSSLLLCWPEMNNAKDYILRIQKLRKSPFDPSLLLSESPLSSKLLELFSDEIFNDPTPHVHIFYKLLSMPKSELLNLKTELQTIVGKMKNVRYLSVLSYYYLRYVEAVWKFLQNESALDDLKHEMVAIQSLADSDQQLLPVASA